MRQPPFRNVRLNGLKPYNEARLWATSISSIHLLQLNVPVVFEPLQMFDAVLVEASGGLAARSPPQSVDRLTH